MQSDYYLDKDKKKNGIKMSLFASDGSLSKDWIKVRWAWSDEVRAVTDELKRDMRQRFSEDAKTDPTDTILDGIVAMVGGWSFKEKATKTRVRAFLKERPDIAERIDVLSANTKLFFTSSGVSSSPGAKTK